MRKVIAAINLALDRFCDPTLIIPDGDNLHYTELLVTGVNLTIWEKTPFAI